MGTVIKSISHTVLCRDEKTKKINNYTRKLAIKLMCTECMGFEGTPRDCTAKLCPLYPYRGLTVATRSSTSTDNQEKE